MLLIDQIVYIPLAAVIILTAGGLMWRPRLVVDLSILVIMGWLSFVGFAWLASAPWTLGEPSTTLTGVSGLIIGALMAGLGIGAAKVYVLPAFWRLGILGRSGRFALYAISALAIVVAVMILASVPLVVYLLTDQVLVSAEAGH